MSNVSAATIVYETLAIFSNGNHLCQASYNQLVRKSGFSRTTVVNAVKELALRKWIRKTGGVNQDKGHLSNRYELLKGE